MLYHCYIMSIIIIAVIVITLLCFVCFVIIIMIPVAPRCLQCWPSRSCSPLAPRSASRSRCSLFCLGAPCQGPPHYKHVYMSLFSLMYIL